MTTTREEALAIAKGPYSKLAIQYSLMMRDLVQQAKSPDFTAANWAALAQFVATDEFIRIGNFRERVRWGQYDDLLTAWAKATHWDYTVERITEGDGYAIIELEEYAKYPDRDETYNSVSVYDYNGANKLKGLKIYLSKAEPLASAHSHVWKLDEVAAEIL